MARGSAAITPEDVKGAYAAGFDAGFDIAASFGAVNGKSEPESSSPTVRRRRRRSPGRPKGTNSHEIQ